MGDVEVPYIDEHSISIAAGPEDVWPAVLDAVGGAFSGRSGALVARAVGCADRTASGPRPLAAGSTIPGFRVVTAVPEVELALVGRHRFSSYALTFRIEALDAGHTRVRAESRAAFPGVLGRAYRIAVIGTGGHAVAVRRLLGAVRRGAERR